VTGTSQPPGEPHQRSFGAFSRAIWHAQPVVTVREKPAAPSGLFDPPARPAVSRGGEINRRRASSAAAATFQLYLPCEAWPEPQGGGSPTGRFARSQQVAGAAPQPRRLTVGPCNPSIRPCVTDTAPGVPAPCPGPLSRRPGAWRRPLALLWLGLQGGHGVSRPERGNPRARSRMHRGQPGSRASRGNSARLLRTSLRGAFDRPVCWSTPSAFPPSLERPRRFPKLLDLPVLGAHHGPRIDKAHRPRLAPAANFVTQPLVFGLPSLERAARADHRCTLSANTPDQSVALDQRERSGAK